MKILLLNQTFYPDPVATSQYLTTLALDLKVRGHQVTVITGNHGYDNPSQTYPIKENYKGIRICRIRYSRFGKRFRTGRALDFASFLGGLFFRLIFLPKQDVTVALTSPPLVAFFGAIYCRLKGGELVQWVMDLNPDEAVAAGWLKESSFSARFLRGVAQRTFRQCKRIIALDRFMKARLVERYGVPDEKITVIPPWAHDAELKPFRNDENPFRKKQDLDGKFVVMYSGNHSPCHPLDTVLEAALRLKEDPKVVFYFIGGGSLVQKITRFKEDRRLLNIVQLPYQPLAALSESLSAADLHLVAMGESYVGILHPCKVYGVLAVGRPFVFIGPRESHMSDLIVELDAGRQVVHGDVQGLLDEIERVRRASAEELELLAVKERAFMERCFGRAKLSSEIMSVLTKDNKTV